ncbi:MAG: prenyltransferase/squalene oxidase repeat-containing protein, partial [Solirubrobacteraceae bacterium]
MSWQLGAFGLLGLALGAGFAWYERERPDARIVALVGTLAAFAALGRIAFAAVPNVKPTTDIVLIAGYALGGAPGFAVGALAALSSNFFFGQGPWTPWQMAAWGATGVLGATLAWGMRRRTGEQAARAMGRWPLAIVCCAAGFAFTVVQDVGDWVSFSDHSLSQLGFYVAQGLGFDAVHAAGCLAFALALGPALTRSIQRFARRIKVTWVPAERMAAPLLVAALAVGSLGALGSQGAVARAATITSPSSLTTAAANYLLSSENADGGFGPAPGQPSDQLYAGWAALGLSAAGRDLNGLGDAESLVSYISRGAGTHDVGALERTILVVRAAGQSARSFGGRDLIAALESRFGANGSISDQVNLTAFAVLALRAAGVGGVGSSSKSMRWLARQQDSDGGFSFSAGGGSSDVDDTGAALEALAGDPAAGAIRTRATAFLRRQQDRDGGFPSQPGMSSNAQSTAWAIQGLEAAGVSPATLHRGGAISPLAYLDSLVATNGAVRYSRGVTQTPVWVTGEALMAMEGKPLPITAPAPPPAPASPAAS